MLINSLKISGTSKKEFLELIFFKRGQKNDIKPALQV